MHKILDFQFREGLSVIKDTIISSIQEDVGNNSIAGVEDIHRIIDKTMLNDLRLNAFKRVNLLDWEYIISQACFNDVKMLLGCDLLIQKRINLSIQIPGDEQAVLAAHSDCNSGESPFELNIWVPLTNCFSTNSMFLFDSEKSRRYYAYTLRQEGYEVKPAEADFVSLEYGQYMIFPPTLIHGNVVNRTNTTRLSLNVRVKSIFSPYLNSSGRDRMYGAFFKEWHISDLYHWNKEILDLLT